MASRFSEAREKRGALAAGPGPAVRALPADRPPRRRRARRWIAVALGLSVAWHLGVIAPFVLRLPGRDKDKAKPPPATVELVMEEQRGSGPDQAPPAPPPEPPAPVLPPAPPGPPSPPPPAAQDIPPPPPPEPDAEPLPAPAPSAAQPAPEPAPEAKQEAAPPPAPPPVPQMPEAEPAPELNLRGTDSPSNATVDESPNIIAASPDNRFRNRDPVYPEDAARRGQQGMVQLLIHVAPDGTASAVDVVASSGVSALDRSARDAVLKWHFHPGTRDGLPVESEFKLQVRFRLGQ